MDFRAKLRAASAIKRRWTQAGQIGGVVQGVRFTRAANGEFVTGLLTAAEIGALQQADTDVRLEVFAALHGAIARQSVLDDPFAPASQPPIEPGPQVDLAVLDDGWPLRVTTPPPPPTNRSKPVPPSQWSTGRR